MPAKNKELKGTPQIVSVVWLDSSSSGDAWTDAKEVVESGDDPRHMECFSTGYLVHDGKVAITLALSFNLNKDGSHNEYGNTTQIPKVAILSLTPHSS